MTEPTPAEIEAVKVLIAHGRTRIEGCDCGWGMDGSKLGQSHALHVWRKLQRVLPDHDAPAAAVATEWKHPSNGRNDVYRRAVRDRLREQWPQLATALDDLARAHRTGEDPT